MKSCNVTLVCMYVCTLSYDTYTCAAITFFVCDCICVCQGMFTHILVEFGQACAIMVKTLPVCVCVCVFVSVCLSMFSLMSDKHVQYG